MELRKLISEELNSFFDEVKYINPKDYKNINNINEKFNYSKLKYRFEQTLKNNGVGDLGKLNVDKLTKYTYNDGIRNILMELEVMDNEYDEEYDRIVEEKFKNNKFYKIWVNYVRNMDRRRKGSSLDFYSFINYITYRNVYSFNDDENHIFGIYENGFFKPSHFSSKTIFGGTKLIKEILHYNNIIFLVTPDLKDMLIKLGAYTKDDLILPMFFRGELVYKNLILTSPKLLVEIMFEIDDIEELLNKKYEDIYGNSYDYNDQYKYKKRDYINKNMGRNRKPLTEELHNVDDDVNLLYNKFFKSDIDEVKRTGVITKNLFKEYKIDTSILKNPKSIKTHKLNPCEILINHGGNSYNPVKHIIILSINKNAVDHIIDNYDGNLKEAVDDAYDDLKDSLNNEFEEHKIKGSIHHELTHWIDDTLYGSHIDKYLKKNNIDKKYNRITVNTLPFEINAQIHAIKQIKNKNEDKWDDLTFGNLIKISPSLFQIYRTLSYDDKIEWIKKLKKRMYREGLLGKKMYN